MPSKMSRQKDAKKEARGTHTGEVSEPNLEEKPKPEQNQRRKNHKRRSQKEKKNQKKLLRKC